MAQPRLDFYKALFEELDPEQFPRRFMQLLLELQGVERGSIWVKEPEGYRCIQAVGQESEKILGLLLKPEQPSIVGWVIENRRMTISEVGRDRRQAKQIENELDLKSTIILCFPLILKNGEVYGAVEVIDTSHQGDRMNLEPAYLDLLQNLVDIGSIALGNALSFADQRQENLRLKQALQAAGSSRIISRNPAFLEMLKTARNYARTDFPVLITGESGTGKDLVAAEIHRLGRRREHPLLVQNCSAIPDTLLESELFGYKKGAFTGADRDHVGLFEAAQGGTVFLDEIGDMPLNLQARILRVLQNQEIKPLGRAQSKQVDVRVIAATNRDLSEAIAGKVFREDLYYRLNVLPLHLPPLRERREDIPLLLQFFMSREAAVMDMPAKRFTPRALAVLTAYDWRGNIRELENFVKYLLATVEGPVVEPGHLPPHLGQGGAEDVGAGPAFGEGLSWDEMERAYAQHLLARHQGNVSRAAVEARVNRSTFNSRLARLGLRKNGS
ncbi:MAG: sigma-54-dependent Fis family transcriptional regulator [Thermodesulfobacteriota bacterium]